MMNFHVLTLFPEMILQGMHTSITGRAIEGGFLSLEAVNIRDFANNKHNKVDDYPYGGGAGMVMQAEPVYQCCEAVQSRIKERNGRRARVVYVTPQGAVFNQTMAEEFAKEEDLVFLCGHYEGIDERVLEEVVTDYVSIGDYVLTGGELAAMVMMDAISRLVPGVLSNEESAELESFHDHLLEYPQYSRPEQWHGKSVPSVLLSGAHTRIEGWRLEQSILRTRKNRPDLYASYVKEQEEKEKLRQGKKKLKGVIFDMDGTLVDSERIYMEGWVKVFASIGVELPEEEWKTWKGKAKEWINSRVDTYSGSRERTLELRSYREQYARAALENGTMILKPFAKEILELAKERNLKLGVASSSFSAHGEQVLKKLGIYDYFDAAVFADQIKEAKPAPDLYLETLKRMGLKRTETLAFEDSGSGVRAAKAAGVRVVYIPDGEPEAGWKNLPFYQKISDFLEGMALLRRMS